MAFSINTNLASMQAQEYLRMTSDFQAKTINRVTSGLRIVSAGDDAAGLAIANTFRSDQAVLSQGIRNANDGLATLQTIDGGISNIGKLLDRARTLATQSASGTFNGSRSVLNSEFKSVMTEIDRQAQVIGLNTDGKFAKELKVFIGGGRTAAGETVGGESVANGSASVDLKASTVDTRSLGLSSYAATGAYDLRTSSAHNVLAIIGANSTTATFEFYGPGFGSYAAPISVAVNLSGVVDTNTLSEAINSTIDGYSPTSAAGEAFKSAGIKASVNSDGKLVFASDSVAFSAQGNNGTASALLGAVTVPDGNIGSWGAAENFIESEGVREVIKLDGTGSLAWDDMAAGNQTLTVTSTDAAGDTHSVAITLAAATTGATIDAALSHINTTLQNENDAELGKIVAVQDGAASLKFIGSNRSFSVTLGVDTDATAANEGIGGATDQNKIIDSSDLGDAAISDIGTMENAEKAVTALANAVASLGEAQAVVGKGQNTFNFAVSLASTQLTNLAASESRIRDADLALEAANLTKAQLLQQAGIAALAQANSAPQAVLSLLRG